LFIQCFSVRWAHNSKATKVRIASLPGFLSGTVTYTRSHTPEGSEKNNNQRTSEISQINQFEQGNEWAKRSSNLPLKSEHIAVAPKRISASNVWSGPKGLINKGSRDCKKPTCTGKGLQNMCANFLLKRRKTINSENKIRFAKWESQKGKDKLAHGVVWNGVIYDLNISCLWNSGLNSVLRFRMHIPPFDPQYSKYLQF